MSETLRPIIDPTQEEIIKIDPIFYLTENQLDIHEKDLEEYHINILDYLVNENMVDYDIQCPEGVYVDGTEITWDDSGEYTILIISKETLYYNQVTLSLILKVTCLKNTLIEYTTENGLTLKDGDLMIEYFNQEKRLGVYMFDLIKPNNPNRLKVRYIIEGDKGCYVDEDDEKIYISNKGVYKVFCVFDKNDEYKASNCSYLLKYEEDKEETTPSTDSIDKLSPSLSFNLSYVNIDVNNTQLYDIQEVNNPHNVEVVITTNKGSIVDGKLSYQEEGEVTITASFSGNDEYRSQKISYIINVGKVTNQEKKSPNISYSVTQDTKAYNNEGKYVLQNLTNPNNVEVNITSSKGRVEDNVLYIDTIEDCVITATSIETDQYKSETASYILYIVESQKQSPNISFTYDTINQEYSSQEEYTVQEVNNPNNVELTFTPSDGYIDDNMILHTQKKNQNVYITCQSSETELYKSQTIRYVMNIYTASKKYPNFKIHEEYSIEDTLNKNIDIEILRWPKEDGLLYDQDEWTYTSSNYKCQINSVLCQEDNQNYVLKANIKFSQEGMSEMTIRFKGNDTFNSETNRLKINFKEKQKLSPEISFASSYVIQYQSESGEYKIQEVNNPNNVNVTYSSSNGSIDSLTLNSQMIGNIIIYCTSEETDIYKSQTVQYTLEIRETEKLSPELSFEDSVITIYEDEAVTSGHYLIPQTVINPHNVPIKEYTITKPAVYWESYGEIECHYTGDYTVYCTSRETSQYKSETVSYTLRILEARNLISPELSFDESYVEVVKNSQGQYEVQQVNNPHNVPITWSTQNNIGAFNDDHTLFYIDGLWTVSIKVTSQKTDTYKSETTSYTLKIKEASSIKEDPQISFTSLNIYSDTNEEGEYLLQNLNNPNNVEIESWSINNSDAQIQQLTNNTAKLIYSGVSGQFVVTVISKETDQYKQSLVRYTHYVRPQQQEYLNGEALTPINISDLLNQEVEVSLVRILETKNLSFSPEEWTVSSSHSRMNISITGIENENGYSILKGKVKFSSEGIAQATVKFKGNTRFYSETYSIKVNYSQPVIIPEFGFENEIVTSQGQPGGKYLLQAVTNPNNLPIRSWSSNLGEISGNYLVYPTTGDVVITVTTYQTDTYLACTASYTLRITSVYQKQDPGLILTGIDEIVTQTGDGIYAFVFENPHQVPVTISVSPGEMRNSSLTRGEYYYSGLGNISITFTTQDTDRYYSRVYTITQVIEEPQDEFDPNLSFKNSYVEIYQRNDNTYELQFLNNPYDVDIRWYSSEGTIISSSNTTATLEYDGYGSISISASHLGIESMYHEQTVTYNFNILENAEVYEDKFLCFETTGTPGEYNTWEVLLRPSGQDLTIYTSKDGYLWVGYNTGSNPPTTISIGTLSQGEKLYVQAQINQYYHSKDDPYGYAIQFNTKGEFNLSGNIMSLIYGVDFEGKKTFPQNTTYNLAHIFAYCNVKNCNRLVLPATNLTEGCYEYMFDYSQIINPPKLLATTLSDRCYAGMFRNCENLMFTPALPATTLSEKCYYYMFYGCSNLLKPMEILPGNNLTKQCYQCMFENCTALEESPILVDGTIDSACYSQMFKNCTNLKKITLLLNQAIKDFEESGDLYTNFKKYFFNWVYGVSSQGIFYKNKQMNIYYRDEYGNGIPINWEVYNYSTN